jgi:hypothetical protein
VFWFAEVLLDADVTEAEIVPTLAFAPLASGLWTIRDRERREQESRSLVGKYPAFELVGMKDGVPVLRMKPATIEVQRYEGSDLVRAVLVRVLSRSARADATADLYRDVCEREGLAVHGSSPGTISWDFDKMHLAVSVGPREEIAASRVGLLAEYPQVRRFSFPMPSVVAAILGALLGHGQKKNQMFAALLSDLGRSTPMTPEVLVRACVLWHLRGGRGDRRVGRSEQTAEIINTFLLQPAGRELITVSRDAAVWRDATKVSRRFDLARYLMQETRDRDNLFSKRLSTTP